MFYIYIFFTFLVLYQCDIFKILTFIKISDIFSKYFNKNYFLRIFLYFILTIHIFNSYLTQLLLYNYLLYLFIIFINDMKIIFLKYFINGILIKIWFRI